MTWRTGIATRLRGNRFVRFLLVGGLNTLFGYGVFALSLVLGLHYSVAAAVATVVGVLFNFRTTGVLVFGSRDVTLLRRFVTVYGTTYPFGVLVLRAASRLNVDLLLAGAGIILPSAVLSYLLNKAFVFRAGR